MLAAADSWELNSLSQMVVLCSEVLDAISVAESFDGVGFIAVAGESDGKPELEERCGESLTRSTSSFVRWWPSVWML